MLRNTYYRRFEDVAVQWVILGYYVRIREEEMLTITKISYSECLVFDVSYNFKFKFGIIIVFFS